jgi:hypothetical protein
MDCETPIRGKYKMKGFSLEKRRKFHRGNQVEPYLGCLCPLHWDVGLGSPMTSSNVMDILVR